MYVMFSNKVDRTTNRWKNMDESQSIMLSEGGQSKRLHVLLIHLCDILEKGKI